MVQLPKVENPETVTEGRSVAKSSTIASWLTLHALLITTWSPTRTLTLKTLLAHTIEPAPIRHSLAGHELSRRCQEVGQCIFLESLRMGTVGPPGLVVLVTAGSLPFDAAPR